MRGSGVYKVVYFFPQVLSVAIVARAVPGRLHAATAAPLNGLLSTRSASTTLQPSEWLGDPNLALWCVMAVMVWSNVGFYVVLFSAAMQSIPKDIYEAALLDGASRVNTFFRITLPLLWDTVQTAWVYLGIVALDAFALVQIMTVGPGGPAQLRRHGAAAATCTPKTFRDGQVGYASAIGVSRCSS